MDTNRDSAHQSQTEDNFPTFSLGLEFLNEAEREKGKFGEHRQEARVALGYRLGQLLRFFRAVQTSRVLHNSIVHAKT